MVPDSAVIPDALSQCAKEPIHIPGAIQPFGVLLTVGGDELTIHNISSNAATLWNIPIADLVGQPFTSLLQADDIDSVQRLIRSDFIEEQTVHVSLQLPELGQGSPWELRAHYHLDTLYLELEPVAPALTPLMANRFHTTIRDSVRALQSASSVQDLCDRAARQVRSATGFDRVMIYRFDKDWHGVVIAEACGDKLESYLGHHFPASDIPPQARAVFLQNWLRMIPDVDYVPSPIVPDVQKPGSAQPLDLGKSLLRSVSPVHLEYLRNMGVQASLTVSLIDDGELWGLIACHHSEPLLVDADQRIAAETIGRIVSSQLRTKEDLEEHQYRQRLEQARLRIVDQLESVSDLSCGLSQHIDALQALTSDGPGAVAVCYGNQWTCAGRTPPVEMLEQLIAWLGEAYPTQSLFKTSELSAHFPPAGEYRARASGLLAMSLGRSGRDYVFWFRPEQSTTVTWAGAPTKAVRMSGDTLTLHPRQSFDSWKEVVVGKSAPWKAVEIDAVAALRNDIIALALKQEYRKEQAARLRAERLSREKDEMVMMVSHDLKTPLSVISLSYEFIKRFHSGQEPSVQRMIERGLRATNLMTKLITNILDVAKIEAGTMDLELKPESTRCLISEAVESCHAIAAEKGVNLQIHAPVEESQVICERYRILQVLNNLVSNAVKFTPRGGSIAVSAQSQGAEVLFRVADTGSGIPAENLESIFERYWQAEEAKNHGTGLGLWIARGIVEQHNGKLWATSEEGVGSTFHFTLINASCGAENTPLEMGVQDNDGNEKLLA
ncbi:ATP-binding protein [Bordetella sp. 02P26C-1]|uniref:ATP-binding protein n=1 Tax=Bordetella sp. 02P26C-1 TaxID=2683195 RepID=UPI0013557D91|nr:ATP-binding protein [Bordetella sp. 02P26C-1]MVW77771.1 GAF domain-containing protein [Bordetella sp. 02P26C-1]